MALILTSIAIIIPLIYSRLFAKWGEGWVIENGIGHFESVKVMVFLVLIILAFTLGLLRDEIRIIGKRGALRNILIFFTLVFLSLLFGVGEGHTLEGLWGKGQKLHGYLYWSGILLFFFLISLGRSSTRARFLELSVWTGVIVSLIGIIEYSGYSVLSGEPYDITGSWGTLRATSTLGNPNYLAGYLLALIPISMVAKTPRIRWTTLGILTLGIISTGSVIGMTILWFYGIYRLYLISRKWGIMILLCAFFILGILLGALSQSEKWLSLVSRGVLMVETVKQGTGDISGLLFGHGPDGVIDMYTASRSREISSYFPDSTIIDSSHNIVIDFLIFFGVGITGFLFFLLWKGCGQIPLVSREGIILILLFLMMNPAVLSHMLLLSAYISVKKWDFDFEKKSV